MILLNYKNSKGMVEVTVATEPIAKSTVRSWGNSLALRIPSEVIKMAKFTEGVEIGFHISDDGEVVLRPVAAYPEANDQDSLRKLFLSLRGSSKSGVRSHEELYEPMGDESI